MAFQDRFRTGFCIAAIALSVTACGGGSGEGFADREPVPQPDSPLVRHWFMDDGVTTQDPMRAPDIRIIRSVSELATVPAVVEGAFDPKLVGPSLSNLVLLYLEHVSVRRDEIDGAVIGIEKIESNADGTAHVAYLEFCKYVRPPNLPGQPIYSRPYAVYFVSAFTGTMSFQWTERFSPNCEARPSVPFLYDDTPRTLVAVGHVNLALATDTAPLMRIIRTQQEWDLIRPRIAHALPQGYETLDFISNGLVYLEGFRGVGATSRIHIREIRGVPGGGRYQIEVEYCGTEEGAGELRAPFALYRIPIGGLDVLGAGNNYSFKLTSVSDPAACMVPG